MKRPLILIFIAILVTLGTLFVYNFPNKLLGTYEGVLPCASCVGINTKLTLNSDYSYKLEQTYLGTENFVTTTGKWQTNFKKTDLELNYDLEGKKDSIFFTIGENYLDLSSGENNYRLNKLQEL